jgi:SpoIIAA-like
MPCRTDKNYYFIFRRKAMVQIMPESDGKIIGVRASGKLTDQDYHDVLIPALEALINQHGKIRLVCFLDEEFAGMEAGALWDDAKFFLPHRDDFEKMALVGGPQWVKVAMKVFAPLMQGDTKVFDGGQLSEAWKWIRA